MITVRCAIYTRKSSEEGLEQAFNSLDAQREACAAYILSQASEGWTALPDIYDDGGLSGGSLERPALQRILAGIAAGQIDTVVVYKVDRLTRSLLDFSKLVEAFDKAGTSFVSVTQSFNTTSSMGRLTLNMLLSFAQFEREVTAERIRDKIAASKAKGMWMGGTPPIGYAPDGRSLRIVEDHAAIVRGVFERYLALGNVRRVSEALQRDGIGSPVRTMAKTGKMFGGLPLSRGQIYTLLKCPAYIGEIHHKGLVHAALHLPIVEREVWDRTQAQLAANLQGKTRQRIPTASLLAGKVVDSEGEPLVPVHATKGTVRYRYYVSRALQHDPGSEGMRIPARELEAAVCGCLGDMLADGLALAADARLDIPVGDLGSYTARCEALRASVLRRDAVTVRELIQRITVQNGGIAIACSTSAIAIALSADHTQESPEAISLTFDVRLTRSGLAMRLIQSNGALVTRQTNASLIRLIVRARGWWEQLKLGDIDVKRLGAREGVNAAYITRVLRLAFLAPEVIEAALRGDIAAGVDGAALTAPGAISPVWREQVERICPRAV